MAYIDHVQCGTCGAQFKPEEIKAETGGGECPKCGSSLALIDFFGVADAFSDPDSKKLSLDDLMGGSGERPVWEDPDIDPIGGPPKRGGAKRESSGDVPVRAVPAPEAPSAAGQSVLDVLRGMKGKD